MTSQKEYRVGLLCAIACSVMWGSLPVYWKMLGEIDSLLIVFYRIVMSCVSVLIADLFLYKKEDIWKPLKEKGAKLTYGLAGVLISANWGTYIWAVNSGRILQTSIGYFIEPLLVCIFGVLFFREKLNSCKIVAFLFAIAGLGYMLIRYRELPLIGLFLALSFGVYAIIKKKVEADAMLSLLYETIFVVPVALIAIVYMESRGLGIVAHFQPLTLVLLLLSGIATGIPLILFAVAAKKVDMITLGVTEYLSPSISLVLGVAVYGEPFDSVRFTAFALIWVGLVVFTVGMYRDAHKPEVILAATQKGRSV